VLTFRETKIPGVVIIESETAADERGSFARTYCREEFAEHGIDFEPVQVSRSKNLRAGTLRGLHTQESPRAEAKLVSCTRGAAFDVAVDVRPGSSTYGSWVSVELRADTDRSIYIPAGCAHGFQTLADETELLYLISEAYVPDLQRGLRWNDPRLRIDWPREPTVVSERDRGFPDYTW
jgi:dTDP-4-dehydrorhamnose 3,5-epimerase